MRKQWTNEEIELLKKLYITQGLSLCEIEIPNRTKTAIKLKIKKLKLRHTSAQTKEIKSRLNSGENNGMFGKEGWSKGKTKENCKKIREAAKKNSETTKEMFRKGEIDISGEKNGMFGKEPWNKGETKYTNEKIMEYSIKASIAMKEKYAKLTPKEKEARNHQLALAVRTKCKKKNTSIEIKIHDYLIELGLVEGVDFEQNYSDRKFIYDFMVKGKVIECQGDYWHANPNKYNSTNINEVQKKNIKRDINKKNFLDINNIEYMFLWEADIKYNFDEVKRKLDIFLD